MEESLQNLEFLKLHIRQLVDSYDKQKVSMPVSFFYLGLLERVYSGVVGLDVLVKQLKNTPELEFSAGLVARTLLLDFLIGLRGYDIIEGAAKDIGVKEDELKKYCNDTLADGEEYSGKDIKRLYEKGHLTKENAQQFYTWLADKFPAFVQPYSGDLTPPKSRYDKAPSGAYLFDTISTNPSIKPLAAHYEKYSYYSKYEHFSAMSYEIMRVVQGQQIKTLNDAIEILVLHSYVCCLMLSRQEKGDFITEKLQILDNFCRQILSKPAGKGM